MYDINSSMKDALTAIANMKINEDTDHKKLSAICIAIAMIELEKLEKATKEAL